MTSFILPVGYPLKGGNYRITRLLGQGGFGITYEADQVLLGRKVAVKEFFMKDSCNRDQTSSAVSIPATGSAELVEKFRDKFIREARLIASMNNPHIVKIYDVFEENGTAYYVMEALDGGSLTDLIKQNGPLPEPKAIEYICELADALGYIHKRNVLHLDVKPSNVLLGQDGQAVLIDFGISKRYDEGGNQTSSTPVGISEGFAPGEQYRAGDISTFKPATDIYSLGATLYYLVTAMVPPAATEVLNEGLPRPAGISDLVWNAIEKAMAPRVKDRPQSAAEFLALLPAGGMAPAAPAAPSAGAPATVLPGSVPPPSVRPASAPAATVLGQMGPVPGPAPVQEVIDVPEPAPKKKGKGLIIGIIAFLVAAAAGAAAFFFLGNKPGTDDGKPEKIVCDINVSSAPSGAQIYLNGKDTGLKTPATVKDVEEGSYTIVLKLSGYKDGSAEFKVLNDSPAALTVPEIKLQKGSSSQGGSQNGTTGQQGGTQEGGETPAQTGLAPIGGPEAGSEGGHDWVNLGLSVRWATCNVGASGLEQPGTPFAGGKAGVKDAASAVWGGSWRLPTKAEVDELISKCKWEWTTQNGRAGYKITGPNKKIIFLPAVGYQEGTTASGMGTVGVYPVSGGSGQVNCLRFDNGSRKVTPMDAANKFYVRGVCK